MGKDVKPRSSCVTLRTETLGLEEVKGAGFHSLRHVDASKEHELKLEGDASQLFLTCGF